MSAADEDARALAYCAQTRRRNQAHAARAALLAGSTAAYDALVAQWEPLSTTYEGVCNGRREEPIEDEQQGNG